MPFILLRIFACGIYSVHGDVDLPYNGYGWHRLKETTAEMEIFYSTEITQDSCILSDDEAGHCVKVLRHREDDVISVIDGEGTLYQCRIVSASHKKVETVIVSALHGWGAHPYRLHLAVSPTKNTDRYEWFAEKACEIGVDTITPVIGQHSERKVFKTARIEKILISAAKQSLKGAVPAVNGPVSVKEFIDEYGDIHTSHDGKAIPPAGRPAEAPLRLIAYCFEDDSHPRISIKEALDRYDGTEVIVLIGPEGDFSQEEAALAISRGFIPVHLGQSRLRTETAAVTAAEAAYFRWM